MRRETRPLGVRAAARKPWRHPDKIQKHWASAWFLPNQIEFWTRKSARTNNKTTSLLELPQLIQHHLGQVLLIWTQPSCRIKLLSYNFVTKNQRVVPCGPCRLRPSSPRGPCTWPVAACRRSRQRLHLAADTAKVNVKSGVCPSVCPSAPAAPRHTIDSSDFTNANITGADFFPPLESTFTPLINTCGLNDWIDRGHKEKGASLQMPFACIKQTNNRRILFH